MTWFGSKKKEILWFYATVPKLMMIWNLVIELWLWETGRLFWANIFPFMHLVGLKIRIEKQIICLKILWFCTCVLKTMIIWSLVKELRPGQTDRLFWGNICTFMSLSVYQSKFLKINLLWSYVWLQSYGSGQTNRSF